MTRLLVVLPHLGAGGAEQVVLTLLRRWSPERLEPHLALVRRHGPLVDRVPGWVPVHDLAAARVRQAGPALIRLVRRLRPHVVFSTLSYLNMFLLALRPALPRGTKLVVREGTILSRVRPRWRFPALRTRALRFLYGRADRVVCQCEFMREDLAEGFGVPRRRMTVIYNPVDVDALRARAAEASDPFDVSGRPRIVAAGRLSNEKGHDRIVDAMPALLESRPDAHLWILGDDTHPGRPVEAGLRERVAALNLENAVTLAGFQENPWVWFRRADLFVLASHFEGLPNALLEAMACGCPVVALENPGGTREIMERSGQIARYVGGLDWAPWWLDPPDPPPDLSAFEAAGAAEAYAGLFDALSGER